MENRNHSIFAADVINPHPIVLSLFIQTHWDFISNRSSFVGLRYSFDLALHFESNVFAYYFSQYLGIRTDSTVNMGPKDRRL